MQFQKFSFLKDGIKEITKRSLIQLYYSSKFTHLIKKTVQENEITVKSLSLKREFN